MICMKSAQPNGYRISVIIPVLNEASRINSIIDHLCDRGFCGNHEIIVVDGDPDGGTIGAAKYGKVKSILAPKGRARQMNAGADASNGDILLFLHADTRLPDKAPQKIISAMKQEKYVAGAFDLGIDSNRISIKVISYTASWRSHLTRIPYGDQGIFIKRNYFYQIGGYGDMPLMEDVELMRRIKKMGDRIFILPDRISTSARRWEQEGILYCSLRNMIISNLYYIGVSPHTLVKYYGKRKNARKGK